MRSIVLRMASLSLIGGSLLSLGCLPALAQSGPKVVQRSVVLNLEDIDHYWPDPKKDPVFNKAAWFPANSYVRFLLEGPVAPESKFVFEFFKPDGKTWFSVDCFGPDELEAGNIAEVNCNTVDEHWAAPLTGDFAFKIQMKQGNQKSDLFKGKLKVGSYSGKDSKLPQHGIEEDWRVPLGFVFFDQASEPNSPPMSADFWFKHRSLEFAKLTASLHYNGKQVALNTDESNAANLITDRRTNMEPTDPKKDFSYQLWRFHFDHVRAHVEDPDSYDISNWHILDQHPGKYEIKVFYEGKQVRNTTFVIGGDGQLVAPGSAEKDSNGNLRYLLPTQVLGAVDIPWNKQAYLTDIYYGNPSPTTSGILAP